MPLATRGQTMPTNHSRATTSASASQLEAARSEEGISHRKDFTRFPVPAYNLLFTPDRPVAGQTSQQPVDLESRDQNDKRVAHHL